MSEITKDVIMTKLQANIVTINHWLKYLAEIETKYNVKCVLAGGCFRDLLLGVPIKDLDVFIIDNDGLFEFEIELNEAFEPSPVLDLSSESTKKPLWKRVVNMAYVAPNEFDSEW